MSRAIEKLKFSMLLPTTSLPPSATTWHGLWYLEAARKPMEAKMEYLGMSFDLHYNQLLLLLNDVHSSWVPLLNAFLWAYKMNTLVHIALMRTWLNCSHVWCQLLLAWTPLNEGTISWQILEHQLVVNHRSASLLVADCLGCPRCHQVHVWPRTVSHKCGLSPPSTTSQGSATAFLAGKNVKFLFRTKCHTRENSSVS